MTDDVKALIAEAGEIAQYADEQGHHGASRVIRQLVAALWAATVAPAVDREALAEFIEESAEVDWLGNSPAGLADELIASGILRDVRDVQAKTLEQAADAMEAAPGPLEEYREATLEEARYLRARAQAIREARSERD